MKKRIVFMALMMMAALALICTAASGEETKAFSFGEFKGNETVNAEPWGNGDEPFLFFSKLAYLNGTLPDGLSAHNISQYVYLRPAGQDDGEVTPDAGEITFLSGDESLREAVYFEVDSSDGTVNLTTDLDRSRTEPGEARFRVRLKAGSLYYENEYVFRLLSWEEYPLFDFTNPDHSGTAQAGEGPAFTDSFGNVAEYMRSGRQNTNLYSEAQITALLVRDHSKEVMNRLMTAEETELFDEAYEGAWFEIWAERDRESGDWYPQENLWCGMTFEAGDQTSYQFRAEGEYRFTFTMRNSNVQTLGAWIIRVVSYQLTGPSSLMPGETGTYQVQDKNEAAGRAFTLSAEGEGISFDAGTGTLTVAADTPEGTEFTVTAIPSDGGAAVLLRGKVSLGLINTEEFRLVPADGGFSIPLPADEEKYAAQGKAVYSTDESAPSYTVIRYNVYDPLDEFAEDGAVADKYYDMTDFSKYPEYQTEDIALGEHHARVYVFRVPDAEGDYSVGYLLYARNNRLMIMDVNSIPQNGTSWEALPKVTMGDMRRLAEMIEYDPSGVPITTADGAISVSAKDGTAFVTGGKKLALTAAFASPEKVNKKAKNDTIEWSVTGADGAELPAGVKISGKGELTTGKTDEVVRVEVKAESPVFHTSGTLTVTILPAAAKVAVEPTEVWLYNGADASAEVRATIEPDTVPLDVISWETAKKGIIEITPDAVRGTALIRALAAGKTDVQVKEPGGKNAKLTVIVADPAESLELEVKGDAKPGSTVTIKETVLPKQAGNKNVEWSLDVGEDIATFSKGKLKISKTAPEGTVITLTCTAVGAPEPIVKTIQLTVTK